MKRESEARVDRGAMIYKTYKRGNSRCVGGRGGKEDYKCRIPSTPSRFFLSKEKKRKKKIFLLARARQYL